MPYMMIAHGVIVERLCSAIQCRPESGRREAMLIAVERGILLFGNL